MSTWMVVEDEPDIYEVLLAMFGIWGIEGVAFVDGEEAVSWIEDVDNKRFQGELPELALLDIRLPGEINGPQVGERLRRSEPLRDMAIVLTTAYKLTADEEKSFIKQSGADRLIYKPLPKFGDLQTLLESTIAERRQAKPDKDNGKAKPEETPATTAIPATTATTAKSDKPDKPEGGQPEVPPTPKPDDEDYQKKIIGTRPT